MSRISKCGPLKGPYCTMTVSAKQRSKSEAPHWLWQQFDPSEWNILERDNTKTLIIHKMFLNKELHNKYICIYIKHTLPFLFLLLTYSLMSLVRGERFSILWMSLFCRYSMVRCWLWCNIGIFNSWLSYKYKTVKFLHMDKSSPLKKSWDKLAYHNINVSLRYLFQW